MPNFREMPPEMQNEEETLPAEILDDLEKAAERAVGLALEHGVSKTVYVNNEAEAREGQKIAARLAGERDLESSLVNFMAIPDGDPTPFGTITDSKE
ncbi:MAG: hypothetical protein NT093_01630 [Candidatus Moranbacteria bacterium]|nr:hypothetical protein [Candidatus Moranbacteria bacterium]